MPCDIQAGRLCGAQHGRVHRVANDLVRPPVFDRRLVTQDPCPQHIGERAVRHAALGAGATLPSASSDCTVMTFWVRVPVLSVQMVSTDPSDSTTDRRRITALRAAICRAPRARAKVRTMGRLSGTVATARLRVLSATSTSGSLRMKRRMTATSKARTPTMSVICRAMRPTSTWNGVDRSAIPCSVPAIWPTSVAMPVCTTTARPVPCVT